MGLIVFLTYHPETETDVLKGENENLVLKSQAVKKVAFVDSSASPTPPASPEIIPDVVVPAELDSTEVLFNLISTTFILVFKKSLKRAIRMHYKL